MKKLIFGCAALASALVFASSVESSNVFGVLKVDNTDEQVVICVPWVTVGSDSSDADTEKMSPTDLVCTTGLQTDDYMLYYDSSAKKYYSWKISSGAWVAGKTIEGDEVVDATGQKVARGTDAIILVRPNPTTGTRTRNAFYLNGQYKSTAGSTTITVGTERLTTFFAPSSAAPYALNTGTTGSETAKDPTSGDFMPNDKIRFGSGKEFYYKNGAWWYDEAVMTSTYDPRKKEYVTVSVATPTKAVDKVVLPAGIAGIYISAPRATAGTITFTW